MQSKNLDLIEEEVYKCSKCGLCQSVCPVYLALKNEMYLPRGRYVVLNNFFNNKKKLSRKFIKDMDICLNCNACKNFCPSNIDTAEIFTNIKYHFKYKYGVIPFSYIYFWTLFKHRIKRKLFLNDEFYKCRVRRKIKSVMREDEEKVVYFQGCINKYINETDKNAALNLIEQMGYNVCFITKNCCGLPFLSDADFDKFNKNAEKIKKVIPSCAKYIVCSCDSCYETLKLAFKDDEISKKLITLDKLLELNYVDVPVHENTILFKPLCRKDNLSLLKNMPKINKKGSCSLMENFFIMKYPKLANQLIKEVFYKKEETDNKTIITSCLLSLTGLKKALNITKSNAKVCSYAEYISCLQE